MPPTHPSPSPSPRPQKLHRTLRTLVRKIKPGLPKEAPMPGELDSTEVQLARFFGRAVAVADAGAGAGASSSPVGMGDDASATMSRASTGSTGEEKEEERDALALDVDVDVASEVNGHGTARFRDGKEMLL